MDVRGSAEVQGFCIVNLLIHFQYNQLFTIEVGKEEEEAFKTILNVDSTICSLPPKCQFDIETSPR